MKVRRHLWLWLVVASVAVIFHLLVLVYVKPSYLSFLLPSPHAPTGGASVPDAILYVPLELDEPTGDQTVTHLIQEPDAEDTAPPTDELTPPSERAPIGLPSDIGDIASDASRPLPQGPETDIVKIPPRPVQITWPDTRRLKHCLGHQINVRVQVDEDGRILHVEPVPSSSPPECVRAAVQCAEQIVFAPGRINGRAIKMWTEIRIDFRKRHAP
jgi:outer membrane biosynthesis protein TonB